MDIDNPELQRLALSFLDKYNEQSELYLSFLEKFDDLEARRSFYNRHPEVAKYAEAHTKEELSKELTVVALAWAVAEVVLKSRRIS